MKLRVRSVDGKVEGKETFRVEVPPTSTLDDLKTLISSLICPPPPSSAVLHLSLNRKEELASSPDHTLQTLGLTSGDLLFYALSPATTTPQITNQQPIRPTEEVRPSPMSVDDASTLGCAPPEDLETPTLAPNSLNTEDSPAATLELESSVNEMEVEEVSNVKEMSSISIPGFLKKVLEEEGGSASGDLGLLMIAVHAVFLESGFVPHNIKGSVVTRGWTSANPVPSVSYTVPELAGPDDDVSMRTVRLKFMRVGKFVDFYGSLSGGSDCYRLCLDMSRFVPFLVLPVDKTSKEDERKVFEFWKMVKDGLSLPLLIDICEQNGLPSPPCFGRLPTELKIRILEFLPGVDAARFGCTSSELRYLSSNDELWIQKFHEELGLQDSRVLVEGRWKDKFVDAWVRKNNAMKKRIERSSSGLLFRRGPSRVRWPPPIIIGGAHDVYPGGIHLDRDLPFSPSRQNFARHCNFGFNA